MCNYYKIINYFLLNSKINSANEKINLHDVAKLIQTWQKLRNITSSECFEVL